MFTPETKITELSGVGETIAKRLKLIGLSTVRDLLYYYPFRYDDFSKTAVIKDLKPNTSVNITGQVELIQNTRSPRKRMHITEALISDDSGQLKVIWFNQPFIAKNIHEGDKISLAGRVENDYSGIIMKSPVYEKLSAGTAVHTQGIIPNYHLTANITQKQLRFLISQVIKQSAISEWLPKQILESQKLLPLAEALKKIHFPQNLNDIEIAKKRLAFDELFIIQLQSQLIKNELRQSQATPLPFPEEAIRDFVSSLPFKLTDAQKKASWEILLDMAKQEPMTRLLEGDVGSGKTIVALIAMLAASLNNAQAVLMVPTEILAKQHFASIQKLLQAQNINICLITHSEQKTNLPDFTEKSKAKTKQALFDKIKSGEIKIIIGTHALIQEKLEFANLDLAIIDEQHRFGVEQRKILIDKSRNTKDKKQNNFTPHLLSMTATPIPRSLALTIYGDLDISIINEMPPGRRPIITRVVSEDNREKAYAFIRNLIAQNQQVFVICPLIDISDKMGIKSVNEEFKKLDKEIFPDLKIGMLHGRMKAKDKDAIIQDFINNKIKILVSTSVIEVGVDIPNASVMMIEAADHFGLAQLHQFRGRVGRGEHQSYCLLFTESDNPNTLVRLDAMTKYADGFSLAKIDLKHRGPGEVYGALQKGFPELKIASLFDYTLIKAAREEAEKIIKENATLNNFSSLKEKIKLLEKSDYLRG
ncbi:MAG: ATP-dependent DNA helicase RecG [Candidatus Falkowbacteria bacterium GW2011_GWC2_38_22]|uniref:ATP-dependent DNA helicase RecG n=1 Tax=Candidatus Falkowbacteria bacterium GW2011_GWE1_38_31 TaxID=1618638 RepID=A0A0G0N0K0_9BACT|nr:MAG: ATP-dependent DNA helicase RecG [Candidatus Falkowbacteria bacterium GW2011_GWF2_38_1205]KKQ61642.1 MAG: ATP-dependent DNA helicase RecG [Candidatus Falkowbacteria bacterium GW2011_GWC2_38_22]KKQ63743.1 MAG: ATP-dependent DNA helicase RecG [Candidatus Falkowbacteria bacterium GW2011_GWF1_38_22]KKQ65841.1 MAG: ATP-dependent DNA helicase RecG [Candidatus Falkowbacteria bacterium GW2011_GWE2_38_254]KKQ70606.1 MAG: ATP-dependent DNA helicase RecG [Candidatus Falkowbacteria bacterium GW2011_